MKNYTKLLALSCLLIFSLNICFAQTAADSTAVKKIVKQPESPIYVRLELGIPVGLESTNPFTGLPAATINPGIAASFTVGHTFSKCFKLGGGAELLFTKTPYLPLFVNTEFGNHNKRVNATLNLNTGYAFLIPNGWYRSDETSGVFVEFLPTISFGSYKHESRFRISLGTQFISAVRGYYGSPIFEFNNNERFEGAVYTYTVVKMNMLMKFGMDF